MMKLVSLNSLDTQLLFGLYYVNLQAQMAKLLGKTHKSKMLGADTHSVSLTFDESFYTTSSTPFAGKHALFFLLRLQL